MPKVTPSLCAALALGLAACGKQEPPARPAPAATPAPAAPVSTLAASPIPSPIATPAPAAAADLPPTKENLPRILARAAEGTRNVRFGDKLQLDGALATRDGSGAGMDLYWESLADQPLSYTVLVHTVNGTGDILTVADQPQDASARAAKAGEIWKDSIKLTADQLKGAEAVAIGIYHPGGDVLKADRGRRDWNGARLWIALPAVGK